MFDCVENMDEVAHLNASVVSAYDKLCKLHVLPLILERTYNYVYVR